MDVINIPKAEPLVDIPSVLISVYNVIDYFQLLGIYLILFGW